MTARKMPAVVTADAGPRCQPRRTSAATNGRKVAARTTPRTIDTATVGMSVTIWMRDRDDDDQREESHAPLGEPIEPTRNEVGRLVFRARIEDREQGTPDSQHDGNQGDRNEEADDARNRRAGRQRDQDERRMDADGLAVDDRAQDVAVDDVHDRDPDQQQDDRTDALRRQRHEDEDGRGDEPADIRDEPADEDHDGQRSRKRNAEQGQVDEVTDPLDRGQHRHATQVASDPLERVVAGRSDPLARLAGRRLECPTPCLVAVLQEEERQEQREEPDRGHHRHAVHEGPDRGPDRGLDLRSRRPVRRRSSPAGSTYWPVPGESWRSPPERGPRPRARTARAPAR